MNVSLFRGAAKSAYTRVFDALWRRARNPYAAALRDMDSGPGPSGRPGMTRECETLPLSGGGSTGAVP